MVALLVKPPYFDKKSYYGQLLAYTSVMTLWSLYTAKIRQTELLQLGGLLTERVISVRHARFLSPRARGVPPSALC
jgi:hypothetical protein